MEMPVKSVKTLGIGEYQLMREELELGCTPATFGFGKSMDGTRELPIIILGAPLKDKEKYGNADIDSGWGILQKGGVIDAVYLDMKFLSKTSGMKQSVGSIRVRFNELNSSFIVWLHLIIKTNGELMLSDTMQLGQVNVIGITGVPLDIPKLITGLERV